MPYKDRASQQKYQREWLSAAEQRIVDLRVRYEGGA
jgi:hypothetical protein